MGLEGQVLKVLKSSHSSSQTSLVEDDIENPPTGFSNITPDAEKSRWQNRARKGRVPLNFRSIKPTPARGCESMQVKVGAPKLSPDADPNDLNDRRYQRKRSIPATVQGLAYPERIAMLREAFPRLPWVEAYRNRKGQHWPRDRFGDITEGQVADLRSWGDNYGAMVLELKRELCLIRWRTWLDSKFGDNGRRDGNPARVARRKARRDAKTAARRAQAESPAGVAAEKDRLRRRDAKIARHAERRRRGVVWTEAPAMTCQDRS